MKIGRLGSCVVTITCAVACKQSPSSSHDSAPQIESGTSAAVEVAPPLPPNVRVEDEPYTGIRRCVRDNPAGKYDPRSKPPPSSDEIECPEGLRDGGSVSAFAPPHGQETWFRTIPSIAFERAGQCSYVRARYCPVERGYCVGSRVFPVPCSMTNVLTKAFTVPSFLYEEANGQCAKVPSFQCEGPAPCRVPEGVPYPTCGTPIPYPDASSTR